MGRLMEEVGSALMAAVAPRLFPGWVRNACARAGLDPSILSVSTGSFDLAHYGSVLGRRFPSADAALFHYLLLGSQRGLRPRADFDPADYRRRNPDVERAGYEPFAHYFHFGRREGRGGTAAADRPDTTLPSLPDIARILEHRPRDAAVATVDVIVPVYGSRRFALQTIDSVLAAGGTVPYELVVVDDASPDHALRGELELLANKGLLTLLTNACNIGFVGSANRGLVLHAGRDVVLLNSDTKVFDGWLDRLMAALHGRPDTGTATPLSNAATILSYPVTLRDNNRLPGLDFALLDRLCAGLGEPVVELPTAVGFCMAIKRACLDEVGVFDAERFGRGYGEENDFCLRATAAGWRHVAATNLFVWHQGGGSFGPEREVRLADALVTIGQLHPEYGTLVQSFIRRDPLQPVRAALDAARIRADPRPKFLCLGKEVETNGRSEDVVALALVPDIAPFFGQYKLVAHAFPPTPNLPRIDRDTCPTTLSRMMNDLAIREMRLTTTVPLASSLRRSLELAAEAAGVVVRPLSSQATRQ
jgi:GT2 family glycosyltransferase